MFEQILLLIACTVVAVAVVRRFELPPILGYLFVGIVAGPHAGALIHDTHAIELLGEVGVAFLLFSIGLEFSLPQLLGMRRILLGLGSAQVAIGTAAGGLLAWWLGSPPMTAVIVGGALAMSSTAIVIKQLTDQVELQTRHGSLALGILLFQDLAAIPFLVVIPIFAGAGAAPLGLALALAGLKTLFAFAILLAAGRYALRPLFHAVASARSLELFTLTVLLVTLLAAWITEQLGLSFALGAFLAGMMLAETEYRHQIEAELRPFKDVLLGLFFISVGMRLELAVLPEIWPSVLFLTLGLALGKGGLITLLVWAWERDLTLALRTGTVLAQGGEFGFVLLALALGTGLLDAHAAQPILAAIIVSMLVAPIVIRHNRALAQRLLPAPPAAASTDVDEIAAATHATRDHVIVCGYGRVGGQLAALLRAESIPFVAIDRDIERSKDAWEDGQEVFFGDATHRDVLQALGLARARALVISFDDESDALKVLNAARMLQAQLPILVRSRDDSTLEDLLAAGASEVIPETLETSLMLTIRLMLALGLPEGRIDKRVRAVRDNRYRTNRDR